MDSPYHINGSAFKENCNCYTITPGIAFQSGSVWNINKIDLSQSFEFSFEINLGCNDATGADGMVFVLQPISTNIGTSGEGLGFAGVNPSIGIAIDTWQNSNLNDPDFDHISIQRDGDNNHISPNNLAGPVPVSAISNNIEDCNWHVLKIRWNANVKILTAYIDEQERVSDTIDLVKDVFNNDPLVFWGFTGATGGSMNNQRFCTSLNADFKQEQSTETCAPQLIELVDQSRSFGTIVEWHWDFGDGTTSNEKNPPPHYYPNPGNYTISSVVLGNNGCWSDTFKQVITIGSIPVADFRMPDTICGASTFQPFDISFVEFGGINQWNWTINGTPFSGQAPPLQNITGQESAIVSLQVRSKEGCTSETVEKTIHFLSQPTISLAPESNICVGDTLQLQALSTLPENPVSTWNWQPAGEPANSNKYLFSSSTTGEFLITLTGIGENGCASEPVTHTARFSQTNAYAGNDTVVADNQPVQLNASGGVYYAWTPASGLSDPNIANPVATVDRETSYVLTAFTDAGCATTDTVTIKVFKGPEIYVPNAFTPNGDSKNDRLRFIAVGMRKLHFFRVYNRLGQLVYDSLDSLGWDGNFSGSKQPSGNFTWVISGEDYNGNAYRKKGSLLLIR